MEGTLSITQNRLQEYSFVDLTAGIKENKIV